MRGKRARRRTRNAFEKLSANQAKDKPRRFKKQAGAREQAAKALKLVGGGSKAEREEEEEEEDFEGDEF